MSYSIYKYSKKIQMLLNKCCLIVTAMIFIVQNSKKLTHVLFYHSGFKYRANNFWIWV